jgi:hypothetical protein
MQKQVFALMVALGAVCALFSVLFSAQEQPQLHEEVTVRWWLVPVYAVDKAGAPVLNLSPEDIEVYIKNIKVEKFDILKKEFRVTETKKGVVSAAKPLAPQQKKLVFLVFDTTFSPFNVMAKAKAIADRVIAQSDKAAQYVLLSIEPLQGLKYISGPTRDLNAIDRDMKKFVNGKKSQYLLTNAADSTGIRNVRPGSGGIDSDRGSYGARLELEMMARNDARTKQRLASSYTSALMTLNVALSSFQEYSKVIYLYSCGIPASAFNIRTEYREATANPQVNNSITYLTPDMVAFDALTGIGKYLNKSGALLFVVNPAGTRLFQGDPDSGELSLRILAQESGGRYYEGTDTQIADQVNSMEGGYYEVSFPDKPEYEGQELSFAIRSKKPDVTIYTVRNVGREKSYGDMTQLEKEVLVLNILSKGPYLQSKQKVLYAEGQAVRDGGSLVCRIPLPTELARNEWTVYRVARNFATGDVRMDEDTVVPEAQTVELKMKFWGKDYHHDIVLAHTKTGTLVVWK